MKNISLLIALIVSSSIFCQSNDFEKPLQDYILNHSFNGNILIQQKDSIIFSKSYGYANEEFKVPNKLNTRFRIASVTKLFTSVLIYQLVEEGKVKLEDKIGKHLPEYNGEAKDKVTIYQLLTSTSGLQDYENKGDEVYEKRLTTDQIVDNYCSGPLQHVPGEKFNYNNADFVILGKILESIYKKTFYEILSQKIIKPLHLTNTGMFNYSIVDNLAQCYWYNEETKKLERDIPYFVENYYAAGAMYSDVKDLLTFSNSLHKGKLISKNTLRTLLTPQNNVKDRDNYASGLWVYEYNISDKEKHKAASRQGNIWGAEAMVLKIFNNDITIIILSNNIGDQGMWDLVWKIKRIIYKK
ncbi:serine hydrolase domain-containing protein [Aquimarina litoralis]|uniref:serine hydrolase domain-containing protein n=1 Tax=Aquimarina litoralis TaxID=584605 RepID=UPI001C5843AF|nr:serine hydrolase domain-containing protein [Aquimarina litoralis]MBW1296404.1 serine hydrolase [Aquimarina litoralis]